MVDGGTALALLSFCNIEVGGFTYRIEGNSIGKERIVVGSLYNGHLVTISYGG
jgi:hypothetical protein